MENRSHAFAAGLFTIVLTLAIIAALMWFRRDTTVRTPYDVVTNGAVTGLSVNAPVRYRGLPVGRVLSIGFDAARPGAIVVRISVTQGTPITHSTMASLGLQGVTGAAYLQLDEHGSDRRPLESSAEQVATIPMREGLLGEVQQRGEALLAQFQVLTTRLNRLADDDTRRQLLATASSIQQAANGIDRLARRAAPVVDRLPQTMARLDRTLDATNRLATDLDRPDGPLMSNLDRIGTAADRATTTLADISARVGYQTLPRVDALADDVRVATRSLTRAADTVSDHPRSLLFGAPPPTPGPGEPGFTWPAATH